MAVARVLAYLGVVTNNSVLINSQSKYSVNP